MQWTFEVDAADEPAVVPNDRALGASVAEHDDHRDDGAHARQHASGADQHARGVRLAARMSRDIRERRARPRRHGSRPTSPAPTASTPTFTGRVVLTKN